MTAGSAWFSTFRFICICTLPGVFIGFLMIFPGGIAKAGDRNASSRPNNHTGRQLADTRAETRNGSEACTVNYINIRERREMANGKDVDKPGDGSGSGSDGDPSALLRKNIGKRLAETNVNISSGFEVRQDSREDLMRFGKWLMPDIRFHNVLVHSSIPFGRHNVASDGNFNVLLMPLEIDRILSEEVRADFSRENALRLVRLYVLLSAVPPHDVHLIQSHTDIPDGGGMGESPAQYADQIRGPEIDEQKDQYVVGLYVWKNIGGYLEQWTLCISNEWEVKKKQKIIGRGVGDFEIAQ